MPFQKIVASKISSAVTRQIEELILQGVLRPGDRLPAERELSENMEVSRPTLREALAAFKKSKVLRAAFGDPVVDHYLHAGQWEQAEYDRRVTDWELIRYFERA